MSCYYMPELNGVLNTQLGLHPNEPLRLNPLDEQGRRHDVECISINYTDLNNNLMVVATSSGDTITNDKNYYQQQKYLEATQPAYQSRKYNDISVVSSPYIDQTPRGYQNLSTYNFGMDVASKALEIGKRPEAINGNLLGVYGIRNNKWMQLNQYDYITSDPIKKTLLDKNADTRMHQGESLMIEYRDNNGNRQTLQTDGLVNVGFSPNGKGLFIETETSVYCDAKDFQQCVYEANKIKQQRDQAMSLAMFTDQENKIPQEFNGTKAGLVAIRNGREVVLDPRKGISPRETSDITQAYLGQDVALKYQDRKTGKNYEIQIYNLQKFGLTQDAKHIYFQDNNYMYSNIHGFNQSFEKYQNNKIYISRDNFDREM